MIEALGSRGWRHLDAAPVPVSETGRVELRGLRPYAAVSLGPVAVTADGEGRVGVRLVDHVALRCHVGRLPVVVDATPAGELDIEPAKLSQEAFATLRADLERSWLGLLRDDHAATSLPAAPPDVRPLWRQLLPVIEAIKADPRSELRLTPGYARADRLRRPSQLTPAALAAGQRGPVVPTEVLAELAVAADHALVEDTLRRLGALARRQPGAEPVAAGCTRELAHPLFNRRRPFTQVSHGARLDQRYRRVLAVHQALSRSEAVITEGPGDLRAGIKALDRLYEYWVFLKVVERMSERAGGLADGQVGQLATRLPGRHVRLELPPGTTVRLANGTEVAFEPTIATNPRQSWHGLELDPHPDPDRAQSFVTPDVVVWLPAPPPNVVVIDAKYRGRHQIDAAAVDIHARYSRFRFRGSRAVREVVAAHPHPDLAYSYPGYRVVPFVPDQPVVLPHSCVTGPPSGAAPVPELDLDPTDGSATSSPVGSGPAPVTVVADQHWMQQVLGSRRIDLRHLALEALAGREAERLVLVMPDIEGLGGFGAAARRCGWQVVTVGLARSAHRDAIVEAVRDGSRTTVLVSDDAQLLAALDDADLPVEQLLDLEQIDDVQARVYR